MRARTVKMHFSGPLHLGNREALLESTLGHVPSDTLFSALCSVYRMVYGQRALEDLLSQQLSERSLLLSSAFPFYQDIYFLPKPLNLDFSQYDFDFKKARRVKYIDCTLFKKVVDRSFIGEDLLGYSSDPVQGALMPQKYEMAKLYQEIEMPRVALDSMTDASNLYYFSQLCFEEGAGLYCLVQCDDDLWKRVSACFRVLGDEGIGGDRTSGKGGFEAEFPGEIDFPDVARPVCHVMLSLYYPGASEARWIHADYSLLKRSGYVYSPEENAVRKKSVTMMTEGSVVYAASPPRGALIDITPPNFTKHRVWRNGYAFSVASAWAGGAQ